MLTIGGFSRLGDVSARILRHYDQLGLLRPATIGQNGYRYYDEGQLEMLGRIERLKGYGFTLAEIGALLPLPEAELARRIHQRRLAAYAELNDARSRLRAMEQAIFEMEETEMDDRYHVIIMQSAPQKVFGLRQTINVSQTHQLFQQLHEEAEKRGLVQAGPTQLVYMGDEFDYDNMDVEAQMEVAGDADGVRTIPAGLFAATTHTGPYETVKYAYEAVGAWLKQHPEYRVTGGGIERYIKDENMAGSPEELETGVLFPVEKVEG